MRILVQISATAASLILLSASSVAANASVAGATSEARALKHKNVREKFLLVLLDEHERSLNGDTASATDDAQSFSREYRSLCERHDFCDFSIAF